MTRSWTVALTIALSLLSAACGPASGSGATAASSHRTGVTGVAVAGPQCPAETQPLSGSESTQGACSPKPIAATILVIDSVSGHTIRNAPTANDGSFRIALNPGQYRLEATAVAESGLVSPPIDATVTDGYTKTALLVDTGIR